MAFLVKIMSSNLVIEAIKSRRAIRRYSDKAVSQPIIDTILEAGVYAPTAMNLQPWKFTVINNKEYIKQLSDKAKPLIARIFPDTGDPTIKARLMAPENNLYFNAPLMIFISAPKSPYAMTDCALAAENMMLAAYSLDVGSCFVGSGMMLAQDPKIKSDLGLPGDHEVFASMVFGYPKDTPKAPERKKPQILKQIN
jgi:nitroreductase